MALKFGTEEWAEALTRAINASSEYRNAGKGWGVGRNGNILLAIEPDEKLKKGLNLLIRLSGGECRGAAFVDDPHDAQAGFALRAPYGLWREILERRTLAATAILTGRLEVDGDKIALLKHTAAHRAMVGCCTEIDTDFDVG